jgi:DNA-binding MarR family transcriptional regulator
MPNDTRELDQEEMQAWRAVLRAHASLLNEIDKELVAEHRMPLADFEVLTQLADAPDHSQRMTELARSVLLSPSGLTRRLDGLVKSGLVERRPCPNDGRGLLAVLTDQGENIVRTVAPTHQRALRRHFVDCLSRTQLNEVIEIFEPMAERNGDMSASDSMTSHNGASQQQSHNANNNMRHTVDDDTTTADVREPVGAGMH